MDHCGNRRCMHDSIDWTYSTKEHVCLDTSGHLWQCFTECNPVKVVITIWYETLAAKVIRIKSDCVYLSHTHNGLY